MAQELIGDEAALIELTENEVPALEPAPQEPVLRVVVVSGGISRGSYQAGQLWALLEHLKREAVWRRAQGLPPLRLALVGASAGSINAAVATAVMLIEPVWPVDRPLERSPMFRAWVPEGFHSSPHSLDRWPEGVAPTSLIRDDFLDESIAGMGELLRTPGHNPAWRDPLRLAMTTTRLVADTGPAGVRKDLNESFGFEFIRSPQGEVVAHPLRLVCPDDPAPLPGPARRLECEVDDAVAVPMQASSGGPMALSWEQASILIEASSAVPLAFRPARMACEDYLSWSLWPKPACYAAGETDDLLMVDGGVLDGHPFRVGDRVSGLGHRSAGARFFFLDPDMDGSRPSPPPAERDAELTLRFFSQVVPTARAQSVTQFFQDHQHLYEDSTVLEARAAPIGNYLGGFLAFYDQSFRVWDYYAGVHDGYTNLVSYVEEGWGVDCSGHALGAGESDPICEALLPAVTERASPAFFATHRVLADIESGALEGAGWAEVARRVDTLFAGLSPRDVEEAAHVHEMGGALKDYDPLALLRNLRTLALLVATRAVDAEGLGDGYDFAWLSTRLSSVLPCPKAEGCAPFWFVAGDLGGRLPFASAQQSGAALGVRMDAVQSAGLLSPERLADTFTLRQDGAFSVLFRRRVDWQLAQVHRNELLGDGFVAKAAPRTARVVLMGPNRLLSWSAGTPTVGDAGGALGVGWDAWRVRPWSFFGRHVRLPWIYGGFRLYGNPLRWWPGATPNAMVSGRAGVVALQLRGGDRRLWVLDAPITPASGPLFPLTLELGVLAQGAWVYGGSEALIIQPLWASQRFTALAATPALEARLMVLGWVSLAGEWHAFTRDLALPDGRENPELRFIVSLTRPGAVRRDPYGSRWR